MLTILFGVERGVRNDSLTRFVESTSCKCIVVHLISPQNERKQTTARCRLEVSTWCSRSILFPCLASDPTPHTGITGKATATAGFPWCTTNITRTRVRLASCHQTHFYDQRPETRGSPRILELRTTKSVRLNQRRRYATGAEDYGKSTLESQQSRYICQVIHPLALRAPNRPRVRVSPLEAENPVGYFRLVFPSKTNSTKLIKPYSQRRCGSEHH